MLPFSKHHYQKVVHSPIPTVISCPLLWDDAVLWSPHLDLSTPPLQQRLALTTTMVILHVLLGLCRILDRQKPSQATIADGSPSKYQMLEVERDICAPPEFLAFGTT